MATSSKVKNGNSPSDIAVSGTPKISVLIPTYKYGCYIGEAIESILNQTFSDFELIVCDDASGDSTAQVVGEYVEKDSRVRFMENSKNRGMTENWNFTLEEARGEYIKFVFGDDLLPSKDCLSEMVRILDKDDSISLVTSARDILDEKGNKLKSWAFPGPEGRYEGRRVIWNCLLLGSNLIGEPSSVMFRKKDAARGFDLNYRQLVDVEMWFYLLGKGDLYFIPSSLCAFRVHAEQQTEKNKINNRHEIEILNLHISYKQNIFDSTGSLNPVTAFLYRHFLPAHYLYSVIKAKVSVTVANTVMGNSFWIIKGALLFIPYIVGRVGRRWFSSIKKDLGFTRKDSYLLKPLPPETDHL